MTDERYTLAQTNRDRKTTARSASHRVNGSKSKRCTLPSDTMTPAQIRKLSGPVLTYRMDRPYTLTELKGWPEDLRREYMQKILDTYQPTNADLAGMLQCSKQSITYALRQYFGITRKWGGPRARSEDAAGAWQNFVNGVSQDPEPELPPEKTHRTAVTTVSLAWENTSLADWISDLISDNVLQQLDETYHITVTLERRPTA